MKDETILFHNSRRVACVQGSTLRRTLQGSLHFLRKPTTSIAFSQDVLDQAREAGAVNIRVTDIESGIVYKVPFAHFLEVGKPINLGYGDQVYLPLTGWVKTLPGYSANEKPRQEGTAIQLGLPWNLGQQGGAHG